MVLIRRIIQEPYYSTHNAGILNFIVVIYLYNCNYDLPNIGTTNLEIRQAARYEVSCQPVPDPSTLSDTISGCMNSFSPTGLESRHMQATEMDLYRVAQQGRDVELELRATRWVYLECREFRRSRRPDPGYRLVVIVCNDIDVPGTIVIGRNQELETKNSACFRCASIFILK